MPSGKISGDSAIANPTIATSLIPIADTGSNYSNDPSTITRRIDVRMGGVLNANSAATNATNLQTLINNNTNNGAFLHFAEPIACNPITLKSNVHLRGNNMAAFKGSTPYGGGAAGPSANPAGAAFLITSTSTVFCAMQSNTSVEGFVIYYPSQSYTATTIGGTTTYPVTFQRASGIVEGIGLRRLCIVGATACISFLGTNITTDFVADLDIDQVYGYPLGGKFIDLAYCTDIPRINRCHINPGVGFQFLGQNASGLTACPITTALVNDVVANGADGFALGIRCDEAMLSQCFAYGSKTAFHFTDAYVTLLNGAADVCGTGVLATATAASAPDKRVTLIGFSFTGPGSQTPVASGGASAETLILSAGSYYSGSTSVAGGVNNANGSCTVVGTLTSY